MKGGGGLPRLESDGGGKGNVYQVVGGERLRNVGVVCAAVRALLSGMKPSVPSFVSALSLQGYLAHKKLPPPFRTTVGP